jgi:type I restriction enzyme M protein
MNHSEIVSFLWGIADLIKHHFSRGHYRDVILPLTVVRRIDCVLAKTKDKVLAKKAQLEGKLENLDPQLRKAAGLAFYNTSRFDFEKLLDDPANVAANLRKYIHGFSTNMQDVVAKFDFDNTITKLDEAGLLFQVVERFKNVNLHPDVIDNFSMGTVFEELIRKFNEALDENPGEHFTPRDIVHLMVDLMLAGEADRMRGDGVIRTICDPCCGSGGMLNIAKNHILMGRRDDKGGLVTEAINPAADIHLFGQEVNPETYAICKSDLFMKSEDGRDAENILFGSTLRRDSFSRGFDYQIANPPYGHEWKNDEKEVRAEAEKADGRFGAGLPRISDGQLLFLQHMIAHMHPPESGGSRIAIIMNGSPLFTGDAGSGESEIRRWILESDWLEALVALPEQVFYNTGIATYVWVLSNRKTKARRGKVQLIDATSFWTPMRKSLGDKRREIPPEKAKVILEILADFKHDDKRVVTIDGKQVERVVSKIFPTTHFGFRKITVERPLRLNFQASAERIARLEEERAFQSLAASKKKAPAEKAKEEAAGRAEQAVIRKFLQGLPDKVYRDRGEFLQVLKAAAKKAEVSLSAPVQNAVLSALSERDEKAEICTFESGARKGEPEPDPDLRDTESVPLSEAVDDYFAREVEPHVPDAWMEEAKRDPKDGQIGIVGYELNFNRYFYVYEPPRPLEAIQADIQAIERDIVRMLAEITGSKA